MPADFEDTVALQRAMRHGEPGSPRAPLGMIAALRAAFDALLPEADPARQVAVLRIALKALLDEQASPSSRPSRSRAPTLANGEVLLPWPELRDRLRARMEHEKLATIELAAAVGIRRAHATRILSPSGGPPGPQVRAALEEWLSARPERENGAAEPDVEPEPEKVDLCRLTIAQRERLSGHLELDPKSLRAAGLGVDLVERAIVGERLAPALIERLVVFLG